MSKANRENGFDTLDTIGFAVLPVTPMAHSASGGLHLFFALPVGVDIRNTAGKRGRGIGPGLDCRGDGGYVIAPSRGSGYGWDPIWNLETAPLASVRAGLMPHELERAQDRRPLKSTAGLAPYAEAALDSACHRIIAAPAGEQEVTLNTECFAVGTLAGAEAIPADFARRVLLWAAQQIRDHDPRRPWRLGELEFKVARAFADGMRHPRDGRHAA
jgi:bifunctional DNA primase/polymerase-like protein